MTDPYLAKMATDYAPHHNEICIVHDSDLVRLIGVGCDDSDAYYIVQQKGQRSRHGGKDNILWSSAVGAIQPLKGRLDDAGYARLEQGFTRSGCPPTETFAVEDQSIWDRSLSVEMRLVSKCGRFVLSFDAERPDDRFELWRHYPETPEKPAAKILNGEMGELEDLARVIIRQMDEYAAMKDELAARRAAS